MYTSYLNVILFCLIVFSLGNQNLRVNVIRSQLLSNIFFKENFFLTLRSLLTFYGSTYLRETKTFQFNPRKDFMAPKI